MPNEPRGKMPHCPKCEGSYNPAEHVEGVCRHCIPDRPTPPGKTLCEECLKDDQICPECGYPIGS